MIRHLILYIIALFTITATAQTQVGCTHLATIHRDTFCIAKGGNTATIYVDENDWKGVIRAANDLGDDVRKVTGVKSEVVVANSSLSTLHL